MRQHWSLQLDAERLLPSLWTPTGTGTTLPAFTQFRVGRAITMWMNSGLLLAPCGPLGRRQGAPRRLLRSPCCSLGTKSVTVQIHPAADHLHPFAGQQGGLLDP